MMKNKADDECNKSEDAWTAAISQFQTRYSDIFALEKQISFLKSELDSQSFLVAQTENQLKAIKAQKQMQNHKSANVDVS